MSDFYEPIEPLNRLKAEEAIARDNSEELLRVVLAVGLHELDGDWAATFCEQLCHHPHANVRGNAVLSLGYLARRFGKLNEDRVRPIIESALRDSDDYVRGQAHDAADDIQHFLDWALNYPIDKPR
jgi:hypothetical protein